MRILIDNCLPVGLRLLIDGHEVETAAYRGWGYKENGELVGAAVAAGFETLLSIDPGPTFEIAVRDQPIAAVLFPGSQGSRLEDLRSLLPAAMAAIAIATPGEITRIRG